MTSVQAGPAIRTLFGLGCSWSASARPSGRVGAMRDPRRSPSQTSLIVQASQQATIGTALKLPTQVGSQGLVAGDGDEASHCGGGRGSGLSLYASLCRHRAATRFRRARSAHAYAVLDDVRTNRPRIPGYPLTAEQVPTCPCRGDRGRWFLPGIRMPASNRRQTIHSSRRPHMRAMPRGMSDRQMQLRQQQEKSR